MLSIVSIVILDGTIILFKDSFTAVEIPVLITSRSLIRVKPSKFVMICWEKPGLAVPLAQLKAEAADESTTQAVEDWHYWVHMGYEFG